MSETGTQSSITDITMKIVISKELSDGSRIWGGVMYITKGNPEGDPGLLSLRFGSNQIKPLDIAQFLPDGCGLGLDGRLSASLATNLPGLIISDGEGGKRWGKCEACDLLEEGFKEIMSEVAAEVKKHLV